MPLLCTQAWWGHFIALSDGVTAKAIGKIRGVAVGIIIALFAPENGECSFVAIFAACSNFFGGNFLSPQAGAFLLELLGVTRSDYSQLKWAILIRACFRLLPLGALWLVPDGCPTDKDFLERLKRVADPQGGGPGGGWKIVAESDAETGIATCETTGSMAAADSPLPAPPREKEAAEAGGE